MDNDFIPSAEYADLDRDFSNPMAGKIMSLVDEYRATARRVGADLSANLLVKVINAARRESLGDPFPLGEICKEEATVKFLAESLYNEVLEVPLSGFRSVRGSETNLLTLEEWRDCLKEVAESLSNIRIQFLYEG